MPQSTVLSVPHDKSVDTQKTQAFVIPDWHKTSAVFVPALGSACIVSMEVMAPDDVTQAKIAADQDTDWKQVRDSSESEQIAASGVEDCWLDLTPFTRGLPSGAYARFVMGSAQASDSVFKVAFRGPQ